MQMVATLAGETDNKVVGVKVVPTDRVEATLGTRVALGPNTGDRARGRGRGLHATSRGTLVANRMENQCKER